jgi:HAD superfamily hydrolase (TIGR01509 family)
LTVLRAIVFDMDGTITRPHIDWPALRQRVGVPQGMPIMEYIEGLPEPARSRAHGVVEETEMEAADAAVLNPGALELLGRLRRRAVRLALVTNNHRRAMRTVVDRFGLEFDLLLSREDARLKPAPDLLLMAIDRLEVAASEACSVGDGRYDRDASEAAGIRYIHLSHDPALPTTEPTVHSLDELWQHLVGDGLV